MAPQTLADVFSAQKKWKVRQHRAEMRIKAAEKTVRQCSGHLGVQHMIDQIAVLMQPAFPDHVILTTGPFGISHRCHINAVSMDVEENSPSSIVGLIALRPIGDTLELIDYTRNTGQYPVNSMGDMNGLNYPGVPLPDDIDGLVELLQKSIDSKGA